MGPKVGLELKVGIFVLAGLIIFTMIIFSIGDFNVLQRGFIVKLRFNDVGNLEVGASVNLMGVEVGEVKDIHFIYDKGLDKIMVELLLWLKEGTEIRENSIAQVRRLGLMGEKYVNLSLGSGDARILQGGDKLYGQDPITIEDVTKEFYLATREIKEAVHSMNDVLGDKRVRDDFKQSVKNTKELTEKLDKVIDRIEKAEGTIGKLISEDKIYRDLEELVADIKKHPWKLLIRTREKKKVDKKQDKDRGFIIQKDYE